ncbi:hypothetical protein [Streptomyces sp. ME19-01-6]|uniref:hypothetical protein n=1 Tax=Streptomyces sp. ME19-01-6 TaxID=3028686 RepID=UPI0029AD5639|nr:hypothetical protein [Streptomyces sp. ME19-01-6]MDX3231855.1 hypothetical protein [Streptomyces sp. ME19-01-6]
MDRRLIRTAVFGSPDSDEPALCPETAEELDAFRREYENVTIWCGTMFEGGCGRQLMTRRCTDKICHFAHYGSSGSDHQCGRKQRGKDSADHLFTKAHLASWLRALDIAAEFTYPEPLGSAVVVRLEDGRTLLVHLDRNRPVAWENGAWETILGPGVRIAPGVLAQRGYIHRVRFDDRPGGGRTMQFGTEVPGEGSKWGSLNEVVLTSESLVTPTKPVAIPAPADVTQRMSVPAERAIVTVAPSTGRTAPAARQGDPVRQALLRLDIALRDHPGRILAAVEVIRRLLETDQKSEDVARLRIALGRGERWLEERARLRRAVVERLKERPTPELYWQAADLVKDPDASAEEREAVAAVEARARRAQEQQRAARERERAERREAEERERAERRETEERERAETRERYVHQARVEKVEKFALAVRGALKKAAREGRTTTWSEIQQKTGLHQLGRLEHDDKVELLALVESATAPENPLWSTLLAAAGDGAGLRLHRDVSNRLSRPLPVSDADLINQLAAERTQLHRQ